MSSDRAATLHRVIEFPLDDETALNARQRQDHLRRMSESELDVVVVGGGVTGCGIALDAASRGLTVGLLEQRDYGSGTSSRSSKLFHGGLRYLQSFQFGLVREALAERNLMIEIVAPHLVEPASFLYPLTHRIWERAYVGAGVLLYDFLAALSRSPLPRHRHLTRNGVLELAPGLSPSAMVGGIRYWDAMVDDARHTITVARTAAHHGALLATSVRVVGMLHDGDRVAGVRALDLETGHEFDVAATSVISATGVWTDDLQVLAGEPSQDVKVSKGIHLVVPRETIPSSTGMILRTATSVLLVVPWGDHWIIGTTDTSWGLHRAHPAASASDIRYLVDEVNRVLSRPVTRDDVIGVYAGLRPLLRGETDSTSKLSREHAVMVSRSGLVAVAGGKLTTYRIMARDAIDAALPSVGRPVPVSRTEGIPLVAADRADQIDRLTDEWPDLASPLGESRFRRVDVVYGVTHEGALHLDDVLTRRTRISIETRSRGTDIAPEVARLMGDALGWDATTRDREIGHYRARVAAERDSQTRPDDQTADAARMGAPDVRTGSAD